MAKKDDKNQHRHEYERKNPGATPGTPHRPDSAYGMSRGKAGGTYGDADDRPKQDGDEETPGGQAPEKVGDRPDVSKVRPEDYPREQRRNSRP